MCTHIMLGSGGGGGGGRDVGRVVRNFKQLIISQPTGSDETASLIVRVQERLVRAFN